MDLISRFHFKNNKTMKKLKYLCVLLTLSALSCTKNFDNLNVNPTQIGIPDVEPVMTQVFKATADRLETDNLNFFWEYANIIEPIGERYSAGDDALWGDFYTLGLGNTRQLKKIYGTNPAYANRMAIISIWECYMYSVLVATYGPIPYSQAGLVASYIPFDDENTIYSSLLTQLKQASDAINLSGDKLTTDVIYGGDLTKWKKFANSLRLKIALRCQRNVPTDAVAAIKDVMANETMLISSDADDAKFQYGIADGSQSPYWTKYQKAIVASASTPTMGDYVFTYFRSYKDPRMQAYFNQSVSGFSITDTLTSTADALHHIVTYKIPYLGAAKYTAALVTWGIPGNVFYVGASYSDSYSTLPGVNGKPVTATSNVNLVAADRPFYFMNYADVCFMEAEASALGYGGAQTADKYYYNGINANFAFWGLSTGQSTAYEAQPGIQWNTAGHGFNYALGYLNTSIPTDNFTKIWIQQWLNSYVDGSFDAWCLFRRTQFIQLPVHTNPGTPNNPFNSYGILPDRFPYPTTETASNPNGVSDGATLLGAANVPQTLLKFAKPYPFTNWASVRAFLDYSEMEKYYGTTIQSLTTAGVVYTETGKY
jgi:hypothetical protein